MSDEGDKAIPYVLYLTSSLRMGGAECLLLDIFKHFSKIEKPDISLSYLIMNNLTDDYLRKELLATQSRGWFWDREESDRSLKYFFRLAKLVREQKITIIHTHTTGSKYWGMIMKLIYPRVKLIYTVHSSFDVTRYHGIKLFLHKKMVDYNIAISNICKSQCIEKGITKVSVINNGISLSEYAVRGECKYDEIPKLLTVARVIPEIKGQDLILEALSICVKKGHPFKITFVGNISGEYEEAYKKLLSQADSLSLPSRYVEIAGQINDMNKEYAKYDGYVCASRKEGLGISIIEAMNAGLLVTTCDEEGPTELVDCGETGFLFKNGSAESLADAIIDAYFNTDVDEKNKMIQAARAGIKKFDIREMFQKYCQVYKTIFEGRTEDSC